VGVSVRTSCSQCLTGEVSVTAVMELAGGGGGCSFQNSYCIVKYLGVASFRLTSVKCRGVPSFRLVAVNCRGGASASVLSAVYSG
jgi:hypothetical protein